MKTLVIVTHPNLEASRINKAWVEELKQHPDITVHQLYETYPDEVIDVEREQKLIEAHDRIVFQYPFYWYSSPPLLKKWFDHVLQYGWAYGPGGDKLQGKEIGAAISTYGTAQAYQPDGSNKFTLEQLLTPIAALSNYVSASYVGHYALSDVGNVTDEQLEESKKAYVNFLQKAKLANAVN